MIGREHPQAVHRFVTGIGMEEPAGDLAEFRRVAGFDGLFQHHLRRDPELPVVNPLAGFGHGSDQFFRRVLQT